MITVELEVNGTSVSREVDERTLLLEFLREELRLTGTHDGCREAKCGCCTVLVDENSVKSCNVLAAQMDGASVTTVEGLAPTRVGSEENLTIERFTGSYEPAESLGIDTETLHPVQKAFRDNGAVQCGYCTPGMIAATIDFLNRNPNPTRAEARRGISSVTCRCTGYQQIVDAVMEAAAVLSGKGSSTAEQTSESESVPG